MGSSLAKVYLGANNSPVENFKHGWKVDMVVQNDNIPSSFLLGENKKLCLWRPPTSGQKKIHTVCYTDLLPQNILVLGSKS